MEDQTGTAHRTTNDQAQRAGFWRGVRRSFARGLAVLLPALLTVIILLWAYQILQVYLAGYVNELIKIVIALATPYSREQLNATWVTYQLDWVGLVGTLIIVLAVGMLVANFVGRTVWWVVESLLLRVPLFKQVYPYVKQVTDFLLSEQPLEFSRVVLAEYPRKGCWSLGFVVNRGLADLTERAGGDWAVLFIPSAPTPMTGYVIQLRRDEIIDVNMTVDQALRFTITCGVVGPAMQSPAKLPAGGQPPVASE